ncbi:MAG: type III-B CRISPR module-associated Cmr3 family protein, partial [Ostreibacterium sp.]
MSTIKYLLLHQVDSWFFRESRSMDGSGATALDSVFPPAANTLMGAIRTQIGNQYHAKNKTDWSSFKENQALRGLIGFGNDYANLQVRGTGLYNENDKQLYFPMPANVVKQAKSGDEKS